ncbi:MAG: hypothetical protein M3N98_02295 [Actinomycetota bacterium]|nr:hypothetical protein [Actinomycetota bacterium]
MIVLLVLIWYVTSVLWRRRHGIIPKRGIGTDADLGALSDKPRIRVRAVTVAGPNRVRVVLTPGPGSDLDMVVELADDDFGYGLLQQWCRSAQALAIVIPPDSSIVRLRSIDDHQHLSLRRVDQG